MASPGCALPKNEVTSSESLSTARLSFGSSKWRRHRFLPLGNERVAEPRKRHQEDHVAGETDHITDRRRDMRKREEKQDPSDNEENPRPAWEDVGTHSTNPQQDAPNGQQQNWPENPQQKPDIRSYPI